MNQLLFHPDEYHDNIQLLMQIRVLRSLQTAICKSDSSVLHQQVNHHFFVDRLVLLGKRIRCVAFCDLDSFESHVSDKVIGASL